MRVHVASSLSARIQAQVLFQVQDLPRPLAAAIEGRWAQQPVVTLPSLGHAPTPVVVAAQAPDWNDAVAVRRRGGAVGRALAAERVGSAAIALPEPAAAQVPVFVAGILQGLYVWDRYQPKPAPRLSELAILGPPALARAVGDGAALGTAVNGCRDLVNLPAEDCGPDEIEAVARALARRLKARIRVLDAAACRRLGMGCLLAVGRASHRPPRLVEIHLRGGSGSPIALCGKGVCFDTGGLNLKTAEGMSLMRKDMAGAATVLCALSEIARRGPTRPVRAYLPLVENAVAGHAYRPGDVLRAADGTTVEVGNTDAEGRLILADAICHARNQGAGAIVTVATLTGAALTALGRIHVPLMASDDALADRMLAAARATGEKMWRLPMDADHRALVKGQVAQLTNSGGPDAACITAGAFLAHFARETPFAHLDISPASWAVKPHDLGPVGATGAMVTTLTELCTCPA